jgi:CPA1 family monovalent cation:H+ antiporter
MSPFELLVGLVLAAIPLVVLAQRARIAYPIVLVVGGLALGFVPHMPRLALPPDLVLVSFLPPLLYWEAIEAPTRAFRIFATPIVRLVVGLVVVTDAACAWLVHTIVPGTPWAAAVAFGAVVAPTDEVAFNPVAERFGIPQRVVAIVSGESLLNDAMSLVLYAVAVDALVHDNFTWLRGGLQLIWTSAAAIAIGAIAAWVVIRAFVFVREPMLQVLVSLLAGYIAYIPAQHAGASGVLATVVEALIVTRFIPGNLPPRTRILSRGAWSVLIFVINTALFILVGVQLGPLVADLHDISAWQLLGYAVAVNALLIALRFAWTLGVAYPIDRYIRTFEVVPPWQNYVLTAWTGFRGAVSLAAALALPLTVAGGHAFPHRNLFIVLTYSVILVTLVGQGAALPFVLHLLRIEPDTSEEDEEDIARDDMIRTSLHVLETLVAEGRVDEASAAELRHRYGTAIDDDAAQQRANRALQLAETLVLDVQHQRLIELRNSGTIENTVMRHLETQIDIKRLELQELLEHAGDDDVDEVPG